MLIIIKRILKNKYFYQGIILFAVTEVAFLFPLFVPHVLSILFIAISIILSIHICTKLVYTLTLPNFPEKTVSYKYFSFVFIAGWLTYLCLEVLILLINGSYNLGKYTLFVLSFVVMLLFLCILIPFIAARSFNNLAKYAKALLLDPEINKYFLTSVLFLEGHHLFTLGSGDVMFFVFKLIYFLINLLSAVMLLVVVERLQKTISNMGHSM